MEEFLPCEPFVVVPLVCAWRATDAGLPDLERAKLVLAQLVASGIVAFDGAQAVASAVEALRVAGIDANAPLVTGTESLSPPETTCVMCESPRLVSHRRADLTGWTCSMKPPAKLAAFEKVCADCGTTHSYGTVSTRPALLVPVADVNRVPVELVERVAELRTAVPIAIRLVPRRPGLSTPKLLRGFDHPAAWIRIDGATEAVEAALRAHLAPLAPQGSDAVSTRYRTTALEAEWFVPHGASGEVFSHDGVALASELLVLCTSFMERTQVGFGGFCMSLHTAACALQTAQREGRGAALPCLEYKVLAATWFEHELLRLSREAGVAPPPAGVSYRTRSAAGLCAEAALETATAALKRHFRAKWAEGHDRQCTRRGNCRLLVMDGNAKVWRRTCSQRYRFYDSERARGAANPQLGAPPSLPPPPSLVPSDHRVRAGVWCGRSLAGVRLGAQGVHGAPAPPVLRLRGVPRHRGRAFGVRAVRSGSCRARGGGRREAPGARRGPRRRRRQRGHARRPAVHVCRPWRAGSARGAGRAARGFGRSDGQGELRAAQGRTGGARVRRRVGDAVSARDSVRRQHAGSRGAAGDAHEGGAEGVDFARARPPPSRGSPLARGGGLGGEGTVGHQGCRPWRSCRHAGGPRARRSSLGAPQRPSRGARSAARHAVRAGRHELPRRACQR